MDVELPRPGTYVVAVSGGVDSIALLHLLHQDNRSADKKPWKLIVAHLDHGIREDSVKDRQLVQAQARELGLPFVYHESHLGVEASEATARTERYKFLHAVRDSSGARAIITAHHQDDVLETAILNMLRGSGRKGLTALGSRHDIVRPLLRVPKQELIDYAKEQGLQWREDSTNQDQRYTRNYVRQRLLSRFSEADKAQLLKIIHELRNTNKELDTLLVNYLHTQSVSGSLDRPLFNHLPHSVAREVLAAWLRANGVKSFDKKTLERLVVAAKVAKPKTSIDVMQGVVMQIGKGALALQPADR